MTNSWLIKNTAAKAGRTISVSPDTCDFKYISAGRIILDDSLRKVSAQNAGAETTLLVLHGQGRITTGGKVFDVNRFDGVYVSRGQEFTVETDSSLDVFEGSAPTSQSFPTAHVKHSDVRDLDSMHLRVGDEPYYREIYKVIAENVKGSRLLTGVTMSKPGNWTSWPPHEHAATQEELYLFFDMPHPAFGTQYIYTGLDQPEMIAPVYEDDAVVIVKGYHPNVAVPGYPINFAWLLCSLEEETYRKLGGVNVQPEFLMDTGLK